MTSKRHNLSVNNGAKISTIGTYAHTRQLSGFSKCRPETCGCANLWRAADVRVTAVMPIAKNSIPTRHNLAMADFDQSSLNHSGKCRSELVFFYKLVALYWSHEWKIFEKL